jgi:hypothetical protein
MTETTPTGDTSPQTGKPLCDNMIHTRNGLWHNKVGDHATQQLTEFSKHHVKQNRRWGGVGEIPSTLSTWHLGSRRFFSPKESKVTCCNAFRASSGYETSTHTTVLSDYGS